MQPFLESLALHLIRTGGQGLGDIRIIVPNRRSGLFLQRHLAIHSKHVQWSPEISSINDFITEVSQLRLSDTVEMLFALYDVYTAHVEFPEPFDDFYFWGEIMLRDFDELDKYLVDAQMLFRNIIDLKELEDPLAGLDTEQINFIRQFWEGFHEGDRTREKDKFLEIWQLLPLLYQGIRAELALRGEGYQGMLYREIAERIREGKIEDFPEGRVVVVGFNALNSCEKQIFSWLKRLGAEFYWDYDHSYTDDQSSEAGRFLRENMEQFPAHAKIEDFRGLEKEKDIKIFELPTDVLQAKTVHRILEREEANAVRECTDTALVLCDEELLMPVIMSLPEQVEETNVTMGYPMKSTPVFSFIDALLRLQHNIRVSKDGSEQFYHKDVTSIILHPYMKNLAGKSGQSLLEKMTKENITMLNSQLVFGLVEKEIFRKVNGPVDLLNYFREIFLQILDNLSGQVDKLHLDLDREFVFQLLIQLNKLESIITSRPAITQAILERLFKKMLSVLRVPFEGEPLSGLQVMGILETRLLDFKHVILLSMNEEVMPASPPGQSYIPYALRIAFRMPAREDMDAIYAYYFNRLLQRAEKVDLLYNSGSEGVRTGEKSRYLYQVIYERGIQVIRPGMEVMAREVPPIIIPHNLDIDLKLKKYTLQSDQKKYLSPSAINTYIDCSLKFYLRYLAGIGEPDEVKEDMDAAGFGTVVHESIRILYSELANRNKDMITREDLEKLLKTDHPENILKDSFLQYHFKGRKKTSIEGRNVIVFRVMLRYLEKIIQTDLKVAPFTLVSVEESYQRNLTVHVGDLMVDIRLGGKIDRVDRVGNLLRVIDYKTGDARMGFPSLEALFDSGLGYRNSAAMQTLFYAWLVAAKYREEEIMPGLYVMKALYEKNFDPALTMGTFNRRTRIDTFSGLEEEYLHSLRVVLGSIFDSAIPFTQTENELKCRYCDFAAICNRAFMD